MGLISTTSALGASTGSVSGGSVLGALGGPIGMIGAALLGGVFGHSSNQKQIALANRQFDWNKYVTENAHQIEVRDLMKAGLNPMLSFRGSGAQAGPSAPMPHLENVGKSASSALTAHLERKAIEAQIIKTMAEAQAAGAQAGKTTTEKNILEYYGPGQAERQQDLTSAQSAEAEQRIVNMQAELPRIAAEIKLKGEEAALANARQRAQGIENHIRIKSYNEIMMDIRNGALIKSYERDEKELGAKAARASWRIWLAEKGLTVQQIENIMGALPNVALVYPLKTITNTTINPGKR